MDPLSSVDRVLLINALAFKSQTITQLCHDYAATRDEIIAFGESHREQIECLREQGHPDRIEQEKVEPEKLTPTQLDQLWIANKFQRLVKLQSVADKLYEYMEKMGADALTVREFRSYLLLAANELGQLLHRGAGDSADADTLHVDIAGIDLERLK